MYFSVSNTMSLMINQRLTQKFNLHRICNQVSIFYQVSSGSEIDLSKFVKHPVQECLNFNNSYLCQSQSVCFISFHNSEQSTSNCGLCSLTNCLMHFNWLQSWALLSYDSYNTSSTSSNPADVHTSCEFQNSKPVRELNLILLCNILAAHILTD
jgi:hypothetical protein